MTWNRAEIEVPLTHSIFVVSCYSRGKRASKEKEKIKLMLVGGEYGVGGMEL